MIHIFSSDKVRTEPVFCRNISVTYGLEKPLKVLIDDCTLPPSVQNGNDINRLI